MIRDICCPIASCSEYPKILCALLFQLVMIPLRFLLTIASSDESIIAASIAILSVGPPININFYQAGLIIKHTNFGTLRRYLETNLLPSGNKQIAMKKVLIVDDDRDLLEMVDMALSDQGFEVCTLEEGKSFFTEIQNFEPDVILLDIFLKDADGRELCQQLKSDPLLQHI